MKVYVVWVRASYCDYDVVNILTTKEEAELFVKEQALNFVEATLGVYESDFSIEEREIGIPVVLEF